MIERFNFYDVYGYLIPGSMLLGLLWLPHAVVQHSFPSAALAAAVAVIVAAYAAGHVLQIVAAKLLPSSVRVENELRAPSDLLLDPRNTRMAAEFKERLGALIQKRFGLDVSILANRSTAFLLCRNEVVASKTASYVEQFQGMYVLMRGLCAAAAAGVAYHIGWLWSPFLPSRGVVVVLLATTTYVALIYTLAWRSPRLRIVFAIALLLAIVCGGLLAGQSMSRGTATLSAAAYVSLLIALWTHGAYRSFTWTWSQTVYQHFYLAATAVPPQKS
jgi:hypothetical protein